MSWWGKIIGGTIGFAIGGPIGALLGAVVGHTFDKSDMPSSRSHFDYADIKRL